MQIDFLNKLFTMKKTWLTLIISILFFGIVNGESIQKFGVKPSNTPEENRINLQKAIDSMSAKGGVL